jgi:2-polyprenyl-3-methyl-5-hydroxy-6-metoxy-1,4-benzoquinol methylase
MSDEQKDQASLDAIKHFYNTVYYKDNNKSHKPNGHLNNLAAQLGVNNKTQVLDVACGTGEWLLACKARGATTCGVDISERAIEACRLSMPDGEFYAQPAETLPFADSRFDVVTCLGSLEHFVRPQQALEEMVRTAKADAQFILLVPNADFLTRKLGLYKGTYQVEAKEEVRTLEAWQALFESAGLTVEKRWKDLHVISLDWICLGKWYLWPVRALQALMLALWPLQWQYQVYHLCTISKRS